MIIQRFEREDGAAAVEFGMIVPFLTLVLFGIIEFGLMFNAQLTLQHAAREGVRVFSITKDGAKAKTATTAATSASNISPVTVTTKDNGIGSNTCTHGLPASVEVTHTYSYLTPMFGAIFGSSTRNLSATGVMRCGG